MLEVMLALLLLLGLLVAVLLMLTPNVRDAVAVAVLLPV